MNQPTKHTFLVHGFAFIPYGFTYGGVMKKAHAILSLVMALTLCVSTFAQSLQNNTTNQLLDADGPKTDQPVDSNAATSTHPVAQRAAKELLIQNATILTASRGTLKNSSILV